MRKYPFLGRLVIISTIALFCVSCNGNKSSQNQRIDIKVTPEIAHIGTDSLVVHNLHLTCDSSEVLVKTSIPYERSVEKEYDGIPLSPQKFTGKWYKMKFKEKINGYNLTVTVYPSDSTDIDDFHFSSEMTSFRIQRNTETFWNPYRESFPDGPDYKYGETYSAIPDTLFVQEDSPTIKDVLFCFKDVDFDGDKELCFREEGFNRHYFSIIKIQEGKPYLLNASPYNNIVYTDYPEHLTASTIFDYENKTITVEEQFGSVSIWKNCYKAKDNISNPLISMRHLWGTQTDFTYYGNDITYFENGLVAGEEIDYDLLEEGCSLVAKYKIAEKDTLRLDSLIFSAAEEKKVLFPIK